MKNYVVWTNCTVEEKEKRFNIEAGADHSVREAYNRMWQISRNSARKFLQGDWEEIVWTDPQPSRGELFKRNWTRVKDLWHKEPCNILYLDADTIFIRPTEIFDKFFEFRMFNWADPKTEYEFLNYYNAAVRYYPATIRSETWQVGQATVDHWSLDMYDYEQIVFNRMYWSQHISMHDRHWPKLNWQAVVSDHEDLLQYQNQWNKCNINEAHIIHAHGSRGAKQSLEMMEPLAQMLNII
jgi:hypothetical protein